MLYNLYCLVQFLFHKNNEAKIPGYLIIFQISVRTKPLPLPVFVFGTLNIQTVNLVLVFHITVESQINDVVGQQQMYP